MEWFTPLSVGRLRAWRTFAPLVGAEFDERGRGVAWSFPVAASMRNGLAVAESLRPDSELAAKDLLRVIADLRSYRDTGYSVYGAWRAGKGPWPKRRTTK